MAPSAVENLASSDDAYIDTNELRTSFALSMSAIYKKEVPLYGDLVLIDRTTNQDALSNYSDPRVTAIRNEDVASERLELERHGAIRLGTPYELRTFRRIFAVIGLHPVGYYVLSPAGLPMHATCIRPITAEALSKNPFRVFTTISRPELLIPQGSREVAENLLASRNIFNSELLALFHTVDQQQGRLRKEQANVFARETLKTFGWRPVAVASKEEYLALKAEHPILADIACFRGAHINYLTPRTLDISPAQEKMVTEGMAVKERIEGPPARNCPILLRQTSFLALEEQIQFSEAGQSLANGSHKARLEEIDERGAAVTLTSRKLYDRLLAESMKRISKLPEGHAPSDEDKILMKDFEQFPDSWDELRRQPDLFPLPMQG